MPRLPDDITGKKFARLTALSYQGNKNWLCRCECGAECVVRASHLKSGNVQSCGCVRRENNKDKLIDLVGKRFGRLTVRSYRDHKHWLCRCDCGTEKIVETKHLRTGSTVSCGCQRLENGRKRKGIVTAPLVAGARFGRLAVESFDHTENGKSFYFCQCDCGKRKSIFRSALLNGDTRSCGCLHKEVSREQAKKNFTTHGLGKEPWYKRWLVHRRNHSSRNWTHEMDTLLFSMFPACVVCSATSRLEADHVIPVTKGGQLEPGNATVLCRICNQTKNAKSLDRLPVEWKEKIVRAAQEFKDAWDNQ